MTKKLLPYTRFETRESRNTLIVRCWYCQHPIAKDELHIEILQEKPGDLKVTYQHFKCYQE